MDESWAALPDGIATVAQLRASGMREARIRTAIRRGDLIRVRRGVVARPDCHSAVIAAALLGGRVAGSSAARIRGMWSPPGDRLVVEVPRGIHVPDTDAVVIRGPAGPLRFGVATLSEIIPQVLRSEPIPFAVAILDSVLTRSTMGRVDLEMAAAHLPGRLKATLAWVDDRAESGTESVARVSLALAGIASTPQVRVPFSELERVDLLVGDRVVLECDSRAHHSTPEDLDRDAARDLMLTALGFHVIRVRYRAAMFDPPAIVAAVRGALAFNG